MLGSPNLVRFVYDGDESESTDDPIAPPGSAEIEALFTNYFAGRGLATGPTAFDGRSDYGPFIAAGIRPAARRSRWISSTTAGAWPSGSPGRVPVPPIAAGTRSASIGPARRGRPAETVRLCLAPL